MHHKKLFRFLTLFYGSCLLIGLSLNISYVNNIGAYLIKKNTI